MDQLISLKAIMNSVVFSLIGMIVFCIGYFIFDKATPGNFWKEILDEHNSALAILVGSVAIAFGLIISAAMHG
ncbi:MAG TPA: DUF350 domain-containing protein [Bdellovibrionales bacterium]|nr:DUF350 domain-containing protein [Bdellovibrionales bacterium]